MLADLPQAPEGADIGTPLEFHIRKDAVSQAIRNDNGLVRDCKDQTWQPANEQPSQPACPPVSEHPTELSHACQPKKRNDPGTFFPGVRKDRKRNSSQQHPRKPVAPARD